MARFEEIALSLCNTSLAAWEDPKYLDEGASAEVYEVHSGSRSAALKVFDPAFFSGDERIPSIERIRRQKTLIGQKHPNLVEIIQAEEAEEWDTWFILMEFIPWPNLKKSLSEIDPPSVRRIIQQLVEVVRWLEEQDLYHRDIKPANIAIDLNDHRLKLLDLGIVRNTDPDSFGTDEMGRRRFISTVQYSPPEYIVREQWSTEQDVLHAVNIYQVGAVLYDLLVKKPLFAEVALLNNKYTLFDAIRDKIPAIPLGREQDLRQLAADCLHKNPRERIQRVTWDRFFAVPDDAAAARARLRQSVAPSAGGYSNNFQRIKLEEAVRKLRHSAVAALQAGGGIFPPHSFREHTSGPDRASASIILTGSPAILAGAEVRLNLTLIRVPDSDHFELFVSAEVTSSDAPFNEAHAASPAWSGNDDGLEQPAVQELLDERFVILYDKGRSALASHAAAGTRPEPREEVE